MLHRFDQTLVPSRITEIDSLEMGITVDISPSKSQAELAKLNNPSNRPKPKLGVVMKRAIKQEEFPVKNWAHQLKRSRFDQTLVPSRITEIDSLEMEITVDISPSKSQAELAELNNPDNRPKPKLGVAMKRAVKQQEFQVKNWPHQLKRSSFVDDPATLQLFVARCCKLNSNHEKGGHSVLLALCVDLPKSEAFSETNISVIDLSWKWILFRTKNSGEFVSLSSLIKLHPPWDEVYLPQVNDHVTICTDFYQFICQTDIDVNYEDLKERVAQCKNEVDDKLAKFFKFGSTSPLLKLLPYKIRNKKRILKQMMLSRRSIELEVIICHVWYYPNSIGFIVKDSDRILTYIEAASNNVGLLEVLNPGQSMRFKNLMFRQRITPKVWGPLFSVLNVLGVRPSQQNLFYYRLAMTHLTTWEVVPELEIPFNLNPMPSITVKELQEISADCDRRLVIYARLESQSESNIIIQDQFDSDIRLIVLMLDSFGKNKMLAVGDMEMVQLMFVRFASGVACLDQFSSIKQ